jgi:hypothetical protein
VLSAAGYQTFAHCPLARTASILVQPPLMSARNILGKCSYYLLHIIRWSRSTCQYANRKKGQLGKVRTSVLRLGILDCLGSCCDRT